MKNLVAGARNDLNLLFMLEQQVGLANLGSVSSPGLFRAHTKCNFKTDVVSDRNEQVMAEAYGGLEQSNGLNRQLSLWR